MRAMNPFEKPVPLDKYQDYKDYVDEPMNLEKVDEKLNEVFIKHPMISNMMFFWSLKITKNTIVKRNIVRQIFWTCPNMAYELLNESLQIILRNTNQVRLYRPLLFCRV